MVAETKVLDVKVIEDRCPGCGIEGEDNFDYRDINWKTEDSELPERSMYQEITCSECGLNFKQWYTVQFAGQQVMLKSEG